MAAAKAESTVATMVGVLTRKWTASHLAARALEHVGRDHALFVVVVAGGEVGLEAGLELQVRVPQPVHRQHELELLGVDLH